MKLEIEIPIETCPGCGAGVNHINLFKVTPLDEKRLRVDRALVGYGCYLEVEDDRDWLHEHTSFDFRSDTDGKLKLYHMRACCRLLFLGSIAQLLKQSPH